MERTTLGRTGIEVSAWSLGTMTWGRQTDEACAHAQIEASLDHGIDFLDTAEMYPVNPVLPETIGDTETIIGNWIAKTGRRGDIVLATKHTGESAMVRDGAPISAQTIRGALDGSLRRLRTDHVELYQFHWPNRGSFHFRQIWEFDPRKQEKGVMADHVDEVLGVLGDLVTEGKIGAFGLSNDSTWGTMQWLAGAARTGGPRVASVQNEYSLMCRHYDSDLAEMSHHEDVTCLAFSPLACGFLTGKYQDGIPEGSRMAINGDLGGRRRDSAFRAAGAYLEIARRHGLDPVAMALAWCRARPFPCIPIFGATNMDQLGQILAGIDIRLPDEVMAEIDHAHRDHPMPY